MGFRDLKPCTRLIFVLSILIYGLNPYNHLYYVFGAVSVVNNC